MFDGLVSSLTWSDHFPCSLRLKGIQPCHYEERAQLLPQTLCSNFELLLTHSIMNCIAHKLQAYLR